MNCHGIDEENHYTSAKDIAIMSRELVINHPDILNAFRSESAMISALNGSRDYGVRVADNIYRIRNIIKIHEKYKLWFSYKDGYIWEIHIDQP